MDLVELKYELGDKMSRTSVVLVMLQMQIFRHWRIFTCGNRCWQNLYAVALPGLAISCIDILEMCILNTVLLFFVDPAPSNYFTDLALTEFSPWLCLSSKKSLSISCLNFLVLQNEASDRSLSPMDTISFNSPINICQAIWDVQTRSGTGRKLNLAFYMMSEWQILVSAIFK